VTYDFDSKNEALAQKVGLHIGRGGQVYTCLIEDFMIQIGFGGRLGIIFNTGRQIETDYLDIVDEWILLAQPLVDLDTICGVLGLVLGELCAMGENP
jgi:hypothetical protein